MIGSGILFPNAACGEALQRFPPKKITDTFAVSFLTTSVNANSSPEESTCHARDVVSKIAKLKITKSVFDKQAAALKETNTVYRDAIYDEDLVSSWLPDAAIDTVPPPILDAVVAVDALQEKGQMVASGPADATVHGEQDRLDADVDAAKQARYISAFEPQAADLNERNSSTTEVVALMNKLEELDSTAKRSAPQEAVQRCMFDDVGRERILQLSRDIHEKCKKLDASDFTTKVEKEMQLALKGRAKWQEIDENGMPLLQIPRGKVPLSLWDWKVWSQARPSLWRYGDCCNLYPDRETDLSTIEWMKCLLYREEM